MDTWLFYFAAIVNNVGGISSANICSGFSFQLYIVFLSSLFGVSYTLESFSMVFNLSSIPVAMVKYPSKVT
jgi:multidrug transporter EmrE-like cation transporter